MSIEPRKLLLDVDNNDDGQDQAHQELQLWFANSTVQPYPSQLYGMRDYDAPAYTHLQIPVLAVPAESQRCRVAQLMKSLGIPQRQTTTFLSFADVLVLLSEGKTHNALSRQILSLLLQRAIDVLSIFDMNSETEVLQYISLRLAVLQAFKRKLISVDRSEIVQIRRFKILSGEFWVSLVSESAESSVVLTPRMALGLDSGRFLLPKLFPGDPYGVETVVLPVLPPNQRLRRRRVKRRGLCESCSKIRILRSERIKKKSS